jgi:hypothetical protein
MKHEFPLTTLVAPYQPLVTPPSLSNGNGVSSAKGTIEEQNPFLGP